VAVRAEDADHGVAPCFLVTVYLQHSATRHAVCSLHRLPDSEITRYRLVTRRYAALRFSWHRLPGWGVIRHMALL